VSGGDAVARAADVLRKSGDGPVRVMYLLACMPFDFEAFAEWLERHPEDPRAARAAAEICGQADALLSAYVRYAETGNVLPPP
jgi:hypothetical protein